MKAWHSSRVGVWLTAPLAWQAACKVNAGFARVTTIRVQNG
jgi:hypothetical protein